MRELPVYDLPTYGSMIADRSRISAYAHALERLIAPGSVVLDLGTGAGIMALLACRAGAAKVYAVEPDDVIQIAREVVAANGYADRVCFLQGVTTELDLPSRVDGIVADVRGALPLFGTSLVTILDARERFLKPGGWIVAATDSLWAALVSSPSLHDTFVAAWETDYGFDFTAAQALSTNHWQKGSIPAADLLVEPKCWGTLDYLTLQGPHASGEATWVVDRDASGHGIGVWFDTETAPGLGFSNSPLSGERHNYSQAFFPWPRATALRAGDTVRIRLRADFVHNDYIWSWEVKVTDGSAGHTTAEYHQSSFAGTPLAPSRLRRRAEAFVPQSTEDLRIDRRILELMEQQRTLGEISRTLFSEFPRRFRDSNAALTRAADLAGRYSRE